MTTPPQRPDHGDAEEEPAEAGTSGTGNQSAQDSESTIANSDSGGESEESGKDAGNVEQGSASGSDSDGSDSDGSDSDGSDSSGESGEPKADSGETEKAEKSAVEQNGDADDEAETEKVAASEKDGETETADDNSDESALGKDAAAGTVGAASEASDSEEPAASEQHGGSAQESAAETSGTAETPEDPEAVQGDSEQAEGKGRKSKRKVALIAGIAAALVVVLGGAGLAYAYVQANSAEAAAEKYVEIADREVQDPRSVSADDYRQVVCSKAMPQIEQVQKQKEKFLQVAKPSDLEQIKQSKTVLKGVQQDGETGTAKLETSMPGQPPQTTELKLIQEDGSWKLCA
ncbi:Rv0361 family membrane protein [Parasphingorhabdus pacifica]